MEHDAHISDCETLSSNVNLFSPMYSKQHTDCLLCIYQYLPKYKDQISRFDNLLKLEMSAKGCGTVTCIHKILEKVKDDPDMELFRNLPVSLINKHFDRIFGDPMCRYNNSKTFDFFTLFEESNVNNQKYVDFIYRTYKHSRSTSLCPYALLSVYVFYLMEHSVGSVSDFKKKHDFLWVFNCLYNHGLRLAKLS